MGQQNFPGWFPAPFQKYQTISVDGSAVGATPGSAGLDNRGKWFCNISKSTNTVTIDYRTALARVPIFSITDLTGNVGFNVTVNTTSQLVIQTFERDDNTAGVNDADFSILFLTDPVTNAAYS